LWRSVSDLTFIPSLKGVLTHRNGLSRSESSVNYVYKGMKDTAKLETAAVRANEGETGANIR
ncbi:hypothetical protein ACIQ5A_16280, partial [Peribacillus asahii]